MELWCGLKLTPLRQKHAPCRHGALDGDRLPASSISKAGTGRNKLLPSPLKPPREVMGEAEVVLPPPFIRCRITFLLTPTPVSPWITGTVLLTPCVAHRCVRGHTDTTQEEAWELSPEWHQEQGKGVMSL